MQVGQRPDRCSGRAARANHERRPAGWFDLDLPHPARQTAGVGVGSDEPPSLIDNRVQDAQRQDLFRHLIHIRHHGLLMRRGDIGAQAVRRSEPGHDAGQLAGSHQARFVVGVDAERDERRGVQRRRQGVCHRLAQQTRPAAGHAAPSASRSAQKLG